MKILITGAKGYVGSQLAPLLRRKHEVIETTEDVTDIEKLRPYFRNIDVVIHLAISKKEMRRVVVDGTKNVATLCLEYNCKLINFSTESATTDPTSLYGSSKLEAERYLEDNVNQFGLKAVSIRPCGIVDKNWFDESGNKINNFRGRCYPIGKLCKDIENIIENYDFKEHKIYKSYLPFSKILYFIGRIYRAIKRRI